jgi:hypothetical protein
MTSRQWKRSWSRLSCDREGTMTRLTYGRLDEVLRSLGFSARVIADPRAKLYEHRETGALVALPIIPDGENVLPRHLVAVRAVLDAYGIQEPRQTP